MGDLKSIKYTMCTLFDSNYLDKGLVLYDSLEKYASNFTLYVLAMDDKCFEVLTDLNLKHLRPIKLSDFENEDLLRVKQTRSLGEYCWTCSSSLIKYVLDTFQPDYCSYIDADMAFYGDPIKLVDELEQKRASVSIVGHRFNWYERKKMSKKVGKYCVECNTFKNQKDSRELLDIWISQCLECCSILDDGVHWGDQKYMDNWVRDYSFVIETEHLGAGVAPWNVAQYKFVTTKDNSIVLSCRKNRYALLFYHFENIKYITDTKVNISVINSWSVDIQGVVNLYSNYLTRIREKKNMLSNEFGIDVLLRAHPGINNSKEDLLSKIKRFCKPSFWTTFIMISIPLRLYGRHNIVNF